MFDKASVSTECETKSETGNLGYDPGTGAARTAATAKLETTADARKPNDEKLQGRQWEEIAPTLCSIFCERRRNSITNREVEGQE